ncbi:MAG TPA: APC family permease [Candidatus Acidoferrum sp.]|nr:APC family permease [Candidatus Acidoferrum sp.]
MATTASGQLATAEASVQQQSAALRKELGFPDLVLASILLVVIPDFFGTAVKAGPAHVVLWLLAILLFFIPQAVVVAHLNRLMPLEGGLYEWTRLAFNDKMGFLVAWNLWLYVVLYVASAGLVTVNYVAYAVGPSAASMAANRWVVLTVSVGAIALLMFIALLGLRVGKWVTNAGSFLTVVVIAFLAFMPVIQSGRGTLHGYHPLHIVAPPLTLFSLSVFSKMTFGALCGFEYAAIFAGESRNPGRDLKRAILLTAPLIALLYIFGTSAILAYVPPDSVDVIGPIPQALSSGFAGFGFARIIVPLAILLLFSNYLSTFGLNFTANTRLPMVAGWDHLLPEWFTHLHAKYKTPFNSILFLGGITMAIGVVVLVGVADQEAFVLLQTWGFTFYGLAYLALFAIPLFARKQLGIRPSMWLRIAAASGFTVTLLFVLFSVSPIISVKSESAYAVKTVSVLLGANGVGLLLYRMGARSRSRSTTA